MLHTRLNLILLIVVLATVCMPVQADTHKIVEATPDKKNRDTLEYSGWAILKRQIIDPTADAEDWISMRDISISDDGKILKFTDGDTATPYSIELIVITHEPTNITVLKLALYEQGKDKAITYIWGEPSAKRLGLNLRWIQIGLTRKD